MKRFVFLLGLFLFVVLSRSQSYAQFPGQRDSLGNMRGVKVLVLNTDDQLGAVGLTHDLIQTDVELKLRSSGIPVLPGKDWPEGYQKAVLVVRLAFQKHEALIATDFTVELWRVIDGSPAPYVSTWAARGLGLFSQTVSRASIRERVADQVAEFANDYLAANTSSRKPQGREFHHGRGIQTLSNEIAQLREQLGVASSVPITMGNSDELPNTNPLKVYLATGFDMEVRKRTSERIDNWNKEQAKTHGALAVVTDLSQADVILVQYSDREHPITRVGGNTGKVSTATFIPGSSYIIVPKGEGYEVLWRYQGKSLENGRGVPGQTMRDHFFDLLKRRKR
jgi:hypothetical protein